MAVTDIQAFAHLSEADIEALGRELDQIRADVEKSLGQPDADYIRRAIRVHRGLERLRDCCCLPGAIGYRGWPGR